MGKYWLHVGDKDEYGLNETAIGFKDRWKGTVSNIKKGDRIVTYVKKKSEFTNLWDVTKDYYEDISKDGSPHHVGVKGIKANPIKAKNLAQKLNFVSNKRRWHVHFNKSIYEISKKDFETIKYHLLKDKSSVAESDDIKARLLGEIRTRVATGIKGLDEILDGGFPTNSTLLVTGGPGAGKTIMCLQFLMHGVENGENGVFISMDERPDDLRKEALTFGWDLHKHEKEGKLIIVDVSYPRSGLPSSEKYQIEMPFTLDTIVRTVYEVITEINCKRVVIDSLPAFGLHFDDEAEVRIAVHRLNNLLLSSGCTSIITSEIIPGKEGVSRFGVEEFIARGIILFEVYKEGKDFKRAITILKMRETNYELQRYSFKIGNKGIEVLPHKVVFFDEAARFI